MPLVATRQTTRQVAGDLGQAAAQRGTVDHQRHFARRVLEPHAQPTVAQWHPQCLAEPMQQNAGLRRAGGCGFAEQEAQQVEPLERLLRRLQDSAATARDVGTGRLQHLRLPADREQAVAQSVQQPRRQEGHEVSGGTTAIHRRSQWLEVGFRVSSVRSCGGNSTAPSLAISDGIRRPSRSTSSTAWSPGSE